MAGISSRDIKKRIRSMESTKQITKAMELVAASRLRQAQDRITASRPYFEVLSDTISAITAAGGSVASPFLRNREGGRVLYLVIAGDRGLAGGYNNNVLKAALARMDGQNAAILPIGKKTVDFFRRKNLPLLTDSHAVAADVSIGDCFRIGRMLSEIYLSGQFDGIHMVYTEFISILSQAPAAKQLLPLVPRAEKTPENHSVTLFEPDAGAVFSSIVPDYLGGILYGALCESRCAEQAARRTAMDSAASNADELIAHLRQTYNQARQAAITRELTEIVAGAEA